MSGTGVDAPVAQPGGAAAPRRRWAIRSGAAALATGVALAAALLASGGSAPAQRSGSPAPPRPGVALLATPGGRVAAVRATLIAELHDQALHVTDVACVANGRSWRHLSIVRCNVDFGDPHIEAYCTVVQDGRLLTSFEEPAIPCGHDNAGFQVITFPPGLGRRPGARTGRGPAAAVAAPGQSKAGA